MGVLSMPKRGGTRPLEPSRTPAREALALVHNEFVGAARDLAKARQVADRARDLCEQAGGLFDAASEAAGAAKSTHAEAMLHSAQTGEPVALSASHRELRHAETDAADDLAAAREALATAKADRDHAEDMMRMMHTRLGRAADAVLVDALPKCLAEYSEALDALWVKCEPLWAIWSITSIEVPHRRTVQNHVEAVRGARIGNSRGSDEYPSKARWNAAREALLSNPDAPLPETGST